MENLVNYLLSSNIAVIRENSYLLALVIILVIALPLLVLFRLGLIWILRLASITITRYLDTITGIFNRKTRSFDRFVLQVPIHVLASLLWFAVSLICVLKNSYPLPPYPLEKRIPGRWESFVNLHQLGLFLRWTRPPGSIEILLSLGMISTAFH